MSPGYRVRECYNPPRMSSRCRPFLLARALAAAGGLALLVLSARGWAAPGPDETDPTGTPSPSATEPASGAPAFYEWCAPELGRLDDDVCFALPHRTAAAPRELVIFLHGVIAPGERWQWAQQRGAARAAVAHGLAVIMPPGRQRIRTDSMRDWFTWPTSAHAQQLVESDVLAQWLRARQALEARLGRPFERTYVVGFSNGAYYATSLALRGRLPIDGYAAFAGGVAPGPIRPAAYADVLRVPLYVGYGLRDPAARRDCATLGPVFRTLKWPGKVVASKRVGHEITDAQWTHALEHFRAARPLPQAPPPPERVGG